MKIVLDINVLISGLLTPQGPSAKILRNIIQDKLKVCVDDRIIAEYREVLLRPEWRFSRTDALKTLDSILERSELILADRLKITLPDPKDLMFMEVAVTTHAFAIITGNRRHFPALALGGIRVLSPHEFWDLMR
jgi:putative PIN family toxin of toxin-antitoxin system